MPGYTPGMTFAPLNQAMEEPLRESGCWAWTPLVHSLNPCAYIGMSFLNREGLSTFPSLPVSRPDAPPPMAGINLELITGTVLAFEPNAFVNSTRMNVGGTVTVTETGCEELNTFACRMHVTR